MLYAVFLVVRAALTGKHDTLVRRAHQILNAALLVVIGVPKFIINDTINFFLNCNHTHTQPFNGAFPGLPG